MINKTKLALGIATATLTMAGALVSPQAAAGSKAKHHAEVAGVNSKVDAMEAQLQAMQAEINSLRAAAKHPEADAGKVQELDQWMTSVKSGKAKVGPKDNMVFFRGGFAHANQKRGGTNNSITNGTGAVSASGDILAGGNADRPDKDAWYFGAGFDFGINNDLFGLMENTQVLAELNVEYKQYNAKTISNLTAQNVTTNQLNLSASPKVKFMKGSAFRPWLIPVGLDLNIISPPSGAVTVLNPGLVFGVGADYKIWKDIYVGVDTRYHYTTGKLDGVNTDGVTAGGYLGLGF